MSTFRTKVVEFMGLPRTGKTTAAQALAHSLREDGLRASIIRERAGFCPISDKMGPLFNYWTALSQMKEYIEACDRSIDVLIADRGILDSAVWLHYKNREGAYDMEVEHFRVLLNNRFMNEQTILAIWFSADVDTIFAREYERRLTRTPGTVVNRDVLQGYADTFTDLRAEFDRVIPICEVNTTDLDIQATLAKVRDKVTAALR